MTNYYKSRVWPQWIFVKKRIMAYVEVENEEDNETDDMFKSNWKAEKNHTFYIIFAFHIC